MKNRRLLSLLIAFVLLLSLLPSGDVYATELPDEQIIEDGVYYIRNVYSQYYLQVPEVDNPSGDFVCHMDKSEEKYGQGIVYRGFDYEILYMWKIQYAGDGKYIISPMDRLFAELSLATTDWSEYPLASIENCDQAENQTLWTIELTENGYVIQLDGLDSNTLFAPNMDRSAHPYIVASDYEANVMNCHWELDKTDAYTVLYRNGFYTDNQKIYLLPGDTTSLTELDFQVQTCPNISSSEQISWESTDPTIAALDPNTGVISAMSPGTARIVAYYYQEDEIISRWFTVVVNELAEGTYLINNMQSSMYLDANMPESGAENQVLLNDLTRQENQQWVIKHNSGDRYTIEVNIGTDSYYLKAGRNISGGYYLDMVTVNQFGCTWKFMKTSSGAYILVSDYRKDASNKLVLNFSVDENGDTILYLDEYTDDADFCDEWDITRIHTLNLQVYYDSYVGNYGTSYQDGIENIKEQIQTLQDVYWQRYGICVNVEGPSLIETYVDECPTFATTGVCQCGTCQNSTFTNLRPYHHNNIYNILTRLSLPEPPADAVVLYIGYQACAVVGGNHKEHAYGGVAYRAKGIIGINDFRSEMYRNMTLVHEIGHLYGISDHYDNYGKPSTDDMNGNTQYETEFSECCIYGEKFGAATPDLIICDGCNSIITEKADLYD